MSAVEFVQGSGTRRYPEEWSKDCRSKQVRVELLINNRWVEIPTTEVDLWTKKSGNSDKNTTAKVKFPTKWAGKSVINLIDTFRPEVGENNITYCRIFLREIDEEWQIKHFGYCDNVGQTSNRRVSKMWIKDFDTVVDKMPITENFQRGDLESHIITLISRINDESLVRFADEAYHLVDPDETYEPPSAVDTLIAGAITGITLLRSLVLNRPHKFQSNRDSIKDVLDTLADENNAIWYFEPLEEGVQLVVDTAQRGGQLTREFFSQPEGEITVIQNNATYEINPVTTVTLRGTALYRPEKTARAFPKATVQATNLAEKAKISVGEDAASEMLYLGDTNATQIDEVVAEAKDTLRELISDEGEGVIKAVGKPNVTAYDVIESYYTCGDDLPEEVVPVNYEVEEIQHHVEAGKRYKTTAYVSIFVGELGVEVIEEEYVTL